MTQIVPVFVQMLMFLSPVFYPVGAVPAALRPFYQYNPLSAVIETSRAAVIGQPIVWGAWGMALGFGLVVSILGYAFFQHSRDEFADAL
jgi:lipopolysaccharide transport system permease protein